MKVIPGWQLKLLMVAVSSLLMYAATDDGLVDDAGKLSATAACPHQICDTNR